MRLLQVIDSLAPGGAERSLIEMAPHLASAGIDLRVLTLRPPLTLAESLLDTSISLGTIGANSRTDAYRGLLATAKSFRPKILHCSLFESSLVSAGVSARLGLPLVTSLVSTEYGRAHYLTPSYSPLRVAAAHAAALAAARVPTLFHAVSQDVAKSMGRRLLIRPSRTRVVVRGRDDARLGRRSVERRLAVREALGIGLSRPIVLTVARHEYAKGLDLAVEAFQAVRLEVPDSLLVMVGSLGPHTHALQKLIDKLQLNAAVEILGPREDVYDIMAAADVLCFPSRREGFPGTLVEALALELPVVASGLAACREVLGDVYPLVAGEGQNELAKAVIDVLKQGRFNAQAAGRVRFERLFRIEETTRQMISVYAEALG